MKHLMGKATRRNPAEPSRPLMAEHPWGHYRVLSNGPYYKVREIVVAPGKRFGWHLYKYRAEHWVVVEGLPMINIGDESMAVPVNESVFVPPKTPHCLENPGQEPVIIIAVQTGAYLEEDDIVTIRQ